MKLLTIHSAPFYVTLSLLGPNIFHSKIFSNTLSLYSTLSLTDQASHSYNRTGKIIVLYTSIDALFLTANWNTGYALWNGSRHYILFRRLGYMLWIKMNPSPGHYIKPTAGVM
jgi:hypothetical protein